MKKLALAVLVVIMACCVASAESVGGCEVKVGNGKMILSITHVQNEPGGKVLIAGLVKNFTGSVVKGGTFTVKFYDDIGYLGSWFMNFKEVLSTHSVRVHDIKKTTHTPIGAIRVEYEYEQR